MNVLIGPLAAFEALAIDDYIRSSKTPILTVAGAEDMTQRKPNPWLVRPSSTSSQPSHPMGDYAAKELKLKRAIAIADDFAFGHENVAGFLRAFEDGGGKVVQKIFTPLNAPDYGTYVSQFKNVDCLYTGHAGSNGLKLIRQLSEYGLKGKFTIVGGFTPIDKSVLQQMGEDGVGCYSGCWYSAALDNPINKKFVDDDPPRIQGRSRRLRGRDLSVRRGARARPEDGQRQDRGQGRLHEGAEGSQGAGDARRTGAASTSSATSVGNIYIRKVEKKDGKYLNTVVKTYPNVSQFWTYGKDEFLKNPVYSRDYPPAKNLE